MKKIMMMTMAVALVAFATGCKTTNASKISGPVSAISKIVVSTPIVEAGLKIKGTASLNQVLIFAWGDTDYADGVDYNGGGFDIALPFNKVPAVKAAAAYNACLASGADMILSPNYVVKVEDYFVFKKLTATVTGFAGKINGISNIEFVCPLREVKQD